MILFKEINNLQQKITILKNNGSNIGFVPTMGALHEGHISLIAESLKEGNKTVVSIFVNPAQFNDKKDYDKYPVTIEKDIEWLVKAGADILFLPTSAEIYPDGLQTLPVYDLGYLDTRLEGYYRPGHFQGVYTIMHKLLSYVQPHHLYMGQKDYQQCMVIQKLIGDYGLDTVLHIIPTKREANGLAMSSRNMRLPATAKEKAAAIYHAHLFIKNNLLKLPLSTLRQQATNMVMEAGFKKIDYLEICDAATLQPAGENDKGRQLVVLTAAFIEGVRLIDNLLLN